MNKLKSCPFCGSEAGIPTNPDGKFTIDFLYSQIKIMDKYEEALCNHSIPDNKTKEQCWEDFKAGQAAATQNYADALYEIQDLRKRIAELEAESERFTVHSDIERQDDKSPNDTQSSTIVYGKESEE